ncbi:luciferin sulfotransferase-like isoform X2 [Lycorma delicatula]|uniref:luciferin sulfotransferase-like isoform X2 n=1 Tax=Lycorma delicatula TaxID=130591 RepID=UPI003F50E075
MVVDYQVMDDDVSRRMQESCKNAMAPPEIKLLPSNCVVPANFLNYEQRIRDMDVRPDDVWVCSFPKCGTTWTQEMVWLLGNNISFSGAKSLELYKRFPFLDFTGLWPENCTDIPDSISFIENLPSPRFIKSHLPPSLLPKQLFIVNPKIIYVHRNPKDAAVSYFHHFQLWNNYTGTLDEFLEAFVEDKLVFSPFWEHVLSFWELKGRENVLISSFEEMKHDLSKVLKKTADFLGVTYTEEQEIEILDHLSFKSMKNNPMVNFENDIKEIGKENMAFIRNGEVEGWKKEMTPEIAEKFDIWTKEKLNESDFPSYLNKHIN